MGFAFGIWITQLKFVESWKEERPTMVVNRVKGAEDEKRKLGSYVLFAREVSLKVRMLDQRL